MLKQTTNEHKLMTRHSVDHINRSQLLKVKTDKRGAEAQWSRTAEQCFQLGVVG